MSGYPVGTVAVATVRGVKDVRVMCAAHECWTSGKYVKGKYWHGDDDLTKVRPLVVLDPEDQRVKEFLMFYTNYRVNGIADRLANLIREQIAPTRIPEPGWGAVVQAGHLDMKGRPRWQRYADDSSFWISEGGNQRPWYQLIDPQIEEKS